MGRENRDLRIALFIDFENLVTRTGLTAEDFDIQPVLDKLLEKGKVVFRRAYCDWSRFEAAKENLHSRGVELIDVPPSTRTGKNGADIRLVIDALELAFAREHIDAFAVASGDSDFCPLAYKLREHNRYVLGLAVREATSPLFVKACDEFVYIKVPSARSGRAAADRRRGTRPAPAAAPVVAPPPREEAEPPAQEPAGESAAEAAPEPVPEPVPEASRVESGETTAEGAPTAPVLDESAAAKPAAAASPAPGARRGRSRRGKGASAEPAARPAPAVPDFARDAIASILGRATEPVNPSALKEAIVRREPDFDVRDHGFSTFSRLLEALEKEGMLKRKKSPGGQQWYVVPA